MIQILVALFINFRALKVEKWATVLPAAANPVSVDPSKNGTKRSGSEEVVYCWLDFAQSAIFKSKKPKLMLQGYFEGQLTSAGDIYLGSDDTLRRLSVCGCHL